MENKLKLVLPDGTSFEAEILDNKEYWDNRPAIMIKHIDKDGNERNMTMAEYDDGELVIWNYDGKDEMPNGAMVFK